MIGMTLPIVKHSIAIESPDDVAQAIHEAFHVARTGRPGPGRRRRPVRRGQGARRARAATSRRCPATARAATRTRAQLRKAAAAIAAARRPVLYAGGGVVHAEASAELTASRAAPRPAGDDDADGARRVPRLRPALARACSACTARARRTGRWTRPTSSSPSGARFDDRVTGDLASFAQRAKVVHVDVDAAEIGKNVEAHIPVVGDARQALDGLTRELEALAPDPLRLIAWWERIGGWLNAHPVRRAAGHDAGAIDPEAALDALRRGDRRRRDRRDRRGPAPDVGGRTACASTGRGAG